jgi:hypothetical protein
MVLGRRLVAAIYFDVGCIERSLNITELCVFVLRIGYDHRDDLAVVTNLIGLHRRRRLAFASGGRRRFGLIADVLMGKDVEDARNAAGCR